MGDLTKNISRHELKCACGCCNYQSADFELIIAIQDACNHFEGVLKKDKVTLDITGATRCPEHNASIGGASSTSYHLQGGALDHRIRFVSAQDLYEYYDNKYPNKFGIGLYSNRVHLDSRQIKARW